MDFAGKRKIWFLISLAIIIPGIISLFINGLNLGIDFAGGNLLQVQFEKSVTSEDVRSTLGEYDLQDSLIQESDGNVFIIKTKGALEENQQEEIVKAFENKLGSLELLRSEKVGPTIGKELRTAGFVSLLIALALMVAYITVRFEFNFAIAAILGLVHDVLIVVGIFSIMQFEVDSVFIAAILTIVGYSINDTIVIFDRIRENLRIVKKESLDNIVNKSIKQSLTRSINTTLTTLFVLVSLFIFGGETTKVFSLALIIGIVCGAYSSIFIASPLWLEFRNLKLKK